MKAFFTWLGCIGVLVALIGHQMSIFALEAKVQKLESNPVIGLGEQPGILTYQQPNGERTVGIPASQVPVGAGWWSMVDPKVVVDPSRCEEIRDGDVRISWPARANGACYAEDMHLGRTVTVENPPQ